MQAKAALPLDGRLRRHIGQPLELLEKLRPAVRIAGVIDRIRTEIEIEGADHFRVPERQAE